MKGIYLQIPGLNKLFPELVLATVTRSIGSTPQKPGSSALFGKSGLISGTVGGGVLEGKVQEISRDAILSKESCLQTFYLNKDISNGEDAICGGQVSVLIDSNPFNHQSVFEKAEESILSRIPGVLITMVKVFSDHKILIDRYWMTEKDKPQISSDFIQKIEPEVKSMLLKGDRYDFRELALSVPGSEPSVLILLEPVFPPPSLIIAGAGHIGKVLAHLGNLLDFEVTVIDDRPEYANSKNIPDADHILAKDIGQAMFELKKNSETYIVIVTRGHKDDAAALKPCIGSDAAYIGMIGSKNKVAAMRRNFIDNRWATEQQWETVHAPVGLDIKSKSVEEIAISIVAELVLIKNGKEQV